MQHAEVNSPVKNRAREVIMGLCESQLSAASLIVLAGVIAFIHEKQGGIYWVSSEKSRGVETRPGS